ncbi:WD40 repeat-like protein [Penicillium angulare]|uniref:WD40 repeat-like protein n=1 Tax=Penicillium angulare TaxID=116970 RepID=A0A9W9GCY2_9EURO|nr:WD40 repeat-like protein [Penicillium angulare]
MAGQKRQFLRRAFGRNNEANTASDESNTLHSQAPEPPNVDAKNPSTASLCLKTTSTVRAFPTEPQQLWDEAYESLKHDQPALLEGYEKILARELEVEIIEQNDSHTRRSQMRKIVQRGLDKTEKETRIKQNLGQAMRIPLAVNDIMQLALKQCPEAALAWSAISLSLQIFSNPMNEAEANRNGLKYIYDNMNWYWELSSHLIKESDPDATPYKVLRWELKERIVDLYKDLLSYQIMSVCSYYRNRVFVFLRDIVQLDDWDGSLVNVKNTEAVVREKYQVYWGQQSLDHQKAGTGLLQEISKGVLAQALQQRDIQEEKDDKECLKSLYLTDPAADMEQIQESREFLIPRSCDWIVKHPCFTDWRDFKTIRLLWIKGGPGKGKTMILMTIIKHLSQSLHDNNIPSFFFCQETVKDANARVLRGLIYQILVQNRALISYLRKVYDLQGSKLFESKNTFTALKDIFVEMINDPKLDRVFLVVDALDECQPDDLKPLLSLINACVSNSPQVKWLVSSRHVGEVERQLQRTEYRTELDLDKDVGGLVQGGIEVYINHKLSDLFECFSEIYGDAEPYVTGELQRVEKEFAAEVQKKADGTFLWIALVFRQIKESECDADNVLDFVRQMPPTLKGMYDRMMDQIVNSEGSMFEPCQQALLVAINVYRPLQLCEMIKLAGFKVLSVPNHIIMRCGLLSIRESDQTVSLIHQSAKDYLMDKESKFHSTLFPNGHLDGHRTIVNRSLGAMDLFHKDIEGLRDPAFQLMDDYKPQSGLLNSTAYSCVYWIDHLCEAKSDLTAVDNHRKMDTRDENIMVFLEKHFLHWLEALSLLKSIPKGVVAIMKLLSLLEVGIISIS